MTTTQAKAGATAVALALLVWTRIASGGELDVTVAGIRDDRGQILVAVCTADSFLGPDCPYTARAPAAPGEVSVVVPDVPAGTYAVQAFHDQDEDGRIDRDLFGRPRDGMGFSNDAPMRFGPPRFEDAAISIGRGGRHAIRFTMRYFRDG